MSIPSDLRDVIVARRKADRRAVRRPTLADLEHDGPALSPAAFGAIIGMSREYVRVLLVSGELPSTKTARGHWKIARGAALDYLRRIGIDTAA